MKTSMCQPGFAIDELSRSGLIIKITLHRPGFAIQISPSLVAIEDSRNPNYLILMDTWLVIIEDSRNLNYLLLIEA
jgi:hypothetical protein